MIRKTSTDWKK